MGIRETQVLEGRYRLIERLGVGGMSVVWRGYDAVLGREVAIKMLAPALAPDRASRERIRAEAQAVARLCHPHITNVYDYGEARRSDGSTVPYVVMELIDGEPMSAQLRYGAALPWHQAITVCAEVASALAMAHACGIVHRDVTPNNVMLTAAGAKVVDFGISALVGENDVGPDGALLGTPAYLAPERMDAGVVCPASDVYAVGLLLYRALTGRLPWRATTTTDLLKAHRYADPGPLPPVDGLPDVVVQLCRLCLAKRPEDRPSSAGVARTLAAEAGIVVFLPGPPRARVAHPDWHLQDGTWHAGHAWDAAPAVDGGPSGRDTGGWGTLGTGAETGTSRWPVGVGSISLGTSVRPWPPPAAPDDSRRRPASSALAPFRRGTAARRRVGAALAGVLLLMLGGVIWVAVGRAPDQPGRSGLTGTPPLALGLGQPPVACRVAYRLRTDTGRGFSAIMTVTNTGRQPIHRWRLEFAFPGDQRMRHGSGALWRQLGRDVVVRPTPGTRPLSPDRPMRLTVSGRYQSANPLPVVFELNGSECTAVVSGLAANSAFQSAG